MDEFLKSIAHVWQPHEGQREFLQSRAKTKVLACGRRWGKTDACAVQILSTLQHARPTKHLILAPTQGQAKILFERVVELADAIGLEHGKVLRTGYPQVQFGPHGVAARSGHVTRFLRGHEATHIVVDEAAYVPEELITEVAMPMLATADGDLTLISTPHGMNHFWRFFQMGEQQKGVWSMRAPSEQNPKITPGFLAMQRELLTERSYRIEYEASFEDSVGRVFRTEDIDACIVPRLEEPRGQIVVGIDWARYSDFTAVAVLQGTRDGASLLFVDRWNSVSWSDQVRRVVEILAEYPGANVLCDATGVGDPVVEMLRSEAPLHAIEGLKFTQETKQTIIENLSWIIHRHQLRMTPQLALVKELQHFEAEATPRGYRLQAARGHDDLVIALALAARQLPNASQGAYLIGNPRKFSRRTQGEIDVQPF